MTARHRLNVVGPFYVEDECCTLCGVPWDRAPELFDHDDVSCWVKKQPASHDELTDMVDAMRQQELSCIYYAGHNPDVIRKLHDVGEGAQCVGKADAESPRRVTFVVYEVSGAELLERLGDDLRSRDWLTRVTPPVADAVRLTIRARRMLDRAQTLELELLPDARWELHHDGDSPLTYAVHTWLAAFATDIRWQTERGEQPEPW